MSGEMFRVQIIEYPVFEEYESWDARGLYGEVQGVRRQMWRRPAGWVASADYVERYKSDKFFEPDTDRWFKSRSSAADRVRLLRSMGYEAIVQRSAPVVWPADGVEKVDTSTDAKVAEAVQTLIRAGVIVVDGEKVGAA